MNYSISDSRISGLIDMNKTGNYGERMEGRVFCHSCRGRIADGENYFLVRGNAFCLGCEREAEREIKDLMHRDYLYQL